jgi:hypothetical protein
VFGEVCPGKIQLRMRMAAGSRKQTSCNSSI